MTHDELLSKIDDELVKHGQRGNIVKHSFALRAVVELHKPDHVGECMCTYGVAYPCPTIKAIEKELS